MIIILVQMRITTKREKKRNEWVCLEHICNNQASKSKRAKNRDLHREYIPTNQK